MIQWKSGKIRPNVIRKCYTPKDTYHSLARRYTRLPAIFCLLVNLNKLSKTNFKGDVGWPAPEQCALGNALREKIPIIIAILGALSTVPKWKMGRLYIFIDTTHLACHNREHSFSQQKLPRKYCGYKKQVFTNLVIKWPLYTYNSRGFRGHILVDTKHAKKYMCA